MTLKNDVCYDRFIKDNKFSVPAKFGGYSLIPDAAIIVFLIFTILLFYCLSHALTCLSFMQFSPVAAL